MIVRYKSPDDRMEIEVECSGLKEMFVKLGPIQELLLEHFTCGKCQSTNIRFNHRVWDDNDYFTLRCMDCTAELKMGQRKDGSGMWPKADGPDSGWSIYERTTQSSTQPQWGSGAQAVEQRQTVPPNDDDSGPVSQDDIPF